MMFNLGGRPRILSYIPFSKRAKTVLELDMKPKIAKQDSPFECKWAAFLHIMISSLWM